MNPTDIIDGALVQDHPNLYVLGCFDRRITFYAQQVRALSLVHALHVQGYLNSVPRIAVIGAGAAGLTAAAAVALAAEESSVSLFESSPEWLSLQSATIRRKLDPHIYNWPSDDAIDEIANLPILDWEAGSARDVRSDVILGFEDVVNRTNQRIRKRTSEVVKKICHTGHAFEISYLPLNVSSTDEIEHFHSQQFDMVFLAVGFGLESSNSVHEMAYNSYWSDAGVPSPEFAARPKPRFFISGNGDGGLIDFVAAATRDFDHGAMIRMITLHTGINEIKRTLEDIDIQARAALSIGLKYDLIAVYERDIRANIERIGLISEVERCLRPGVQLTLQTECSEVFSINTSVLNRLAAFAIIKACEKDHRCEFKHINAGRVSFVQRHISLLGEAKFLIDCDGNTVEADEVIFRRGPDRVQIRKPFLNVLGSYESTHTAWLKRHGEAALVPTLSREARAYFEEKAILALIPPSPRLLRLALANLPITIRVSTYQHNIRWSGALAIENILDLWSSDRQFEVILPNKPADLGLVASAVLRIACHAKNIKLHADPAYWIQLVRKLSTESKHAVGMSIPRIERGNPGGAAQNHEDISAGRLAKQIHRKLDEWMLAGINNHLSEFLSSGADPDHLVGLSIAGDLQLAMKQTWVEWYSEFQETPALLSYFLRLMVCAIDDDDEPDEAQVLIGPKKLNAIIRGTAVSLAIASSWQATSLKCNRPGNLLRRQNEGSEWSGHSCIADMINGERISLCAGSFMWKTDFVILSIDGNIELTRSAEKPFSQIDSGQPLFTDVDGFGPLVLSINTAFSIAVNSGMTALNEMLANLERQHFEGLTCAIEKV